MTDENSSVIRLSIRVSSQDLAQLQKVDIFGVPRKRGSSSPSSTTPPPTPSSPSSAASVLPQSAFSVTLNVNAEERTTVRNVLMQLFDKYSLNSMLVFNFKLVLHPLFNPDLSFDLALDSPISLYNICEGDILECVPLTFGCDKTKPVINTECAHTFALTKILIPVSRIMDSYSCDKHGLNDSISKPKTTTATTTTTKEQTLCEFVVSHISELAYGPERLNVSHIWKDIDHDCSSNVSADSEGRYPSAMHIRVPSLPSHTVDATDIANLPMSEFAKILENNPAMRKLSQLEITYPHGQGDGFFVPSPVWRAMVFIKPLHLFKTIVFDNHTTVGDAVLLLWQDITFNHSSLKLLPWRLCGLKFFHADAASPQGDFLNPEALLSELVSSGLSKDQQRDGYNISLWWHNPIVFDVFTGTQTQEIDYLLMGNPIEQSQLVRTDKYPPSKKIKKIMLSVSVPQEVTISGMVSAEMTLEDACRALATLNPHFFDKLPEFFDSKYYALVATCHNSVLLPLKPKDDQLVSVPVVLDVHSSVGKIASLFNLGPFVHILCVRLPQNKSLTVVKGGMFSSLAMEVGSFLLQEKYRPMNSFEDDSQMQCSVIEGQQRKQIYPQPRRKVHHGIVLFDEQTFGSVFANHLAKYFGFDEERGPFCFEASSGVSGDNCNNRHRSILASGEHRSLSYCNFSPMVKLFLTVEKPSLFDLLPPLLPGEMEVFRLDNGVEHEGAVTMQAYDMNVYPDQSVVDVGTMLFTNYRIIFASPRIPVISIPIAAICGVISLGTVIVPVTVTTDTASRSSMDGRNSGSKLKNSGKLARSEVFKVKRTKFVLVSKDGRVEQFSFQEGISESHALGLLNIIPGDSYLPTHVDQTFAKVNEQQYTFPDGSIINGWSIYDVESEFARIGFSSQFWRVSTANSDFSISDTYPRKIIVPKALTDSELSEISKFRARGRIQATCWLDKRSSASLSRCGQPFVGFVWKSKCETDQKFFNVIMRISRSKELYIFDARPSIAATGNSVVGKGGTEDSANYPNCNLRFLNIGNIHALRDSYYRILDLCVAQTFRASSSSGILPTRDSSFLKAVEATGWLEHVMRILRGAVMMVTTIADGLSVVTHCSDGWDRTPQLTTLCQLLLDPYYRTIHGFAVLIEKEWVSFGHQFQMRSGFGTQLSYFGKTTAEPDTTPPKIERRSFDEVELTRNRESSGNLGASNNGGEKQFSPAFILLLDAVWQIWQQFPSHFEFNESLILFLADSYYDARFGTFLFSTEKERVTNHVYQQTHSVWSHVLAHKDEFSNSMYSPTTAIVTDLESKSDSHPIIPVVSYAAIRLWPAFFLRYSVVPRVSDK